MEPARTLMSSRGRFRWGPPGQPRLQQRAQARRGRPQSRTTTARRGRWSTQVCRGHPG